MNRKKELQIVKDIIKDIYKYFRFGIFDTRNVVGDTMKNIFIGKYFTIDVCDYYGYFEIFGTTNKEFKKLEDYYYELLRGENK